MFHHPSAVPYSKISICLRNDSPIPVRFSKPLLVSTWSKSLPSPFLTPLAATHKKRLWKDLRIGSTKK